MLGFVSAILPDLSLEQVLRYAHEEHFACVEVMCWPAGKAERKFAGVTHIGVAGFTQAQADDTLALAEQCGARLSALGYFPNPLDPDPAVAKRSVDHLKLVIRAAAKLGLSTVNTFIGRDWTKSIDENWPRFLKIWKPILAFAEDQGIRIGIENCPMSFSRDEWPGGKNLAISPVIWRRMFSDIPSKNFGLNFDPSHFILQQMDPISPLREFRERIFHCHAKDMTIDHDRLNEHGIFSFPAHWHTPRIPGFGDIDWGRFLAELRRTGYDGPVCIEVEDETFGTSLQGRKNALRVAGQALRPFFP